MTNKDSGSTPSEATKAEEARETHAPHTADRDPTAEEEKAAPGQASSETQSDYKEMAERGARVKGEGELP